MSESNEDKCLDFEGQRKVTDSEVRAHFAKFGLSNIGDLQKVEKGDEMN